MDQKIIKDNFKNIIQNINPNSNQLEKTPQRAAKAFEEFFSGYSEKLTNIHEAIFDSEMDELIILKNIRFESHCEHHLVPIIGIANIGYIPNGKIIGASKMARIVNIFAHRLQLQERMTMDIAQFLFDIINPRSVAVHIEAEHFCISHRGVKKQDSKFSTKYFIGDIKNNYNLRSEFLNEINSNS